MILFIFAHKGEASTFLKELSLSPIPLIFDGLFGDKDKYLLLITGEGLQSASEKTSAVLSLFSNSITHIINYGICGSLRSEIKKESLITIRSAYGYSGDKPFFKSFQLNTQNANNKNT